jgi:hypothetical protein
MALILQDLADKFSDVGFVVNDQYARLVHQFSKVLYRRNMLLQ